MSQISSMELKARYLGQGMINPLQRYKRIEIEHVPIAVTKSNKLLCIPKTEEVKHIGITGMCYDKETEVLTDKGWKFFKDLDKTELIAQVDPHIFGINFIKPLGYTKEIFKGKMMLFKSRFLNLLVTPNHNMFIAINNNKIGENHFCRADDVPKFNSVKFYCIKKIKQLQEYLYKKNLILSTISKKNIDTLDYNDYVYCVEVPTHLLIVKRHGKIVLCGNTGTCKSVTLNSLLSWHYWFLKRACIILNDIQKETFEWSQPSESFNFLNKKINLNPCGTPIIYTFPSTKTLQLDQRDRHYPFIKMTLPIKEVIRNIEDYYSLDKSKVYLSNLNEELEECKSMSEIKDVLDEKIPKDHIMMKYKLINIFESLFKNRILNVAVPEAPAFLDYKDKFNNVYYNFTIQTLMRAGFVPSIQTWDLRNHDFFSAYMSFIVDSIHKSQYEDVYFKRKTVTIFLDEVDKLWKGDAGELIKKQVGLIGTNGRVARIGLIWSTQNYGAVPDTIKGNTKYLIVSRKNSDKEVNEIKKDFDIPKSMEKDILNLKSDPKNGIFEVVFLTTEKYVLYDLTTGITQLSSEPQYAYIIPPHAKHKVPLMK